MEQLRDGTEFTVEFDRLTNDIGTIRHEMKLHGYYRREQRIWVARSWQHPRPNYPFSSATPPADPMDHKINLWGVIFRFDEAGSVYYPPDTSVAVATLTLGPGNDNNEHG
jgi:hypothetical protein